MTAGMLVLLRTKSLKALPRARAALCCRFSSIDDDKSIKIPPPTWSIASLELDANHPPVSDETLQKLAKLSLLDVHQLHTAQLKQDLGNMMHLISIVQEFASDLPANEYDMYDRPRGVTTAPVRDDSVDDNNGHAKQVWESLLKPKTTKRGGHDYFVIKTTENDANDS